MGRLWWCAHPGLRVIGDEQEAEMEAGRLNGSPVTVERYEVAVCQSVYPENDWHFHVIVAERGA